MSKCIDMMCPNCRADLNTLRAEVEQWKAKVGEVRQSIADALPESVAHMGLVEGVQHLRAEVERLREALRGLVEYERKRHPPKMGGDHYPPSLRSLMDEARAALAGKEKP